MLSRAMVPVGAASTAYPAPSRPRHKKSAMRFSSSTTRILIAFSLPDRVSDADRGVTCQLIKIASSESQRYAIFLAAVQQFELLHLLLLHGKIEEPADRFVGLFLRQDLGGEGFLQRICLVFVTVLHGG